MDQLQTRLTALEQQMHTVTRRLHCWRGLACGAVVLAGLTWALPAGGAPEDEVKDNGQQGPKAVRLATGLEGGSGSTLGPGGALYVTENAAGRISRVDPQTGEVTTVASGLPPGGDGFGGAVDVAFLGTTAYALVTLVGGSDVVGIYRVDGPDRFTVIADIGEFSVRNPPNTPFEAPTGVQYALEPYRGNFLVTDGHHNRVLRVTLDGEATEVIAFGNTVPTGLAVWGRTVFMAEAGSARQRVALTWPL
jgi:sugar lactone lactonase YvrE